MSESKKEIVALVAAAVFMLAFIFAGPFFYLGHDYAGMIAVCVCLVVLCGVMLIPGGDDD